MNDININDFNELIETKTSLKFIEDQIKEFKELLKYLVAKQDKNSEQILKVTLDLNDLKINVTNLLISYNRIGLFNFIKNHWWKIGTFILSIATILAAVGDYCLKLLKL